MDNINTQFLLNWEFKQESKVISTKNNQLSNSGSSKNIPVTNIQPGFDEALKKLQEMKKNPSESSNIVIRESFGSWREWD